MAGLSSRPQMDTARRDVSAARRVEDAVSCRETYHDTVRCMSGK